MVFAHHASPWGQACKAAELAGLQVREAQEAQTLGKMLVFFSVVHPLLGGLVHPSDFIERLNPLKKQTIN